MTSLSHTPPRVHFKQAAYQLLPKGASFDACQTCGLYSSGCPASEFENMDPRKFIWLAMLGMKEVLSTTPCVWTCTQCKRCMHVCPMSIDMQPNRSANYCCGCGGRLLQPGMTEHRLAYGKRKFDQIQVTEADYVLTPCHNCRSQMEDIGEHFGGHYRVAHVWTLICLSLGVFGENERRYLGPELQQVGL